LDRGGVPGRLAAEAAVLRAIAALGVHDAAEMDPIAELVQAETIGDMKQLVNIIVRPLEQLHCFLEQDRSANKDPLPDLPHLLCQYV